MNKALLQTLHRKTCAELDYTLESCKEFLLEITTNLNDDFKTIIEAKPEDLSLHINDDGRLGEAAKLRINKKAIPPDILIELLADIEIDWDDDRNISVNDGELLVVARLYNKLGYTKKAQEARSYMYREE